MNKLLNKRVWQLLLLTVVLPLFSACNDEDDVISIFTNKAWKLSFIALEGSYEQFDFWQGDVKAREKSMNALGQEGNFILNFEGSDINGKTGGSFNGKGISSSPSGAWSADGKTQELSISVEGNPNESDVLGKAFITGLKNAFKYEGDNNNLFIYYKEGQTTKRMGLKPR